MRRLGSALAAAGTVLVLAFTASSAATPPVCKARDLGGGVRRESPGAGQRYATIILVNVGRRECLMNGYPGVQLFRGKRRIPTHLGHAPSSRPRRVVVRPGATLSSLLHWAGVPAADEPGNPCEPSATRARISLPNSGGRLSFAWHSGPVCLHGRMDARPFQAGVPAPG